MDSEDSPPPAPAPVVIQQPATQTETALESAKGSAEGFKYILDQKLLPQYAQQLTDIQRDQAGQMSQINIDQQKLYGPQLMELALENIKRADPTGFEIRQNYGKEVLADIGRGGELSGEERRLREQDIRAAQVSRGLGTGLSDAIDEARYLGEQRYNRRQQALAGAGAFLAGAPPQASFAALNQAGRTAPVGTQDVSGAANTLFPSTNALMANQAANYNTFANFTNATNQLRNNQFQYHDQNTSNPFLTGLASFGGFVAAAAPKSINV